MMATTSFPDAEREIRRRGAAAELGRYLPRQHPLFEFTADYISIGWVRRRVILAYLKHLSDVGLDPAEVTRPVFASYFRSVTEGSGKQAAGVRLREWYREAIREGILCLDPTSGLHLERHGNDWRLRRLTPAEAGAVVTAARRDLDDPKRRLTAHRDLVLIGLGLTLGGPASRLTPLRWGNVRRTEDSVSIETRPSGVPYLVTLAPAVVKIVEEFRTALRKEGADPVPGDALVPSLHPAITAAWADPERPLMAPTLRTSIDAAIRHRYVQAGVVPAGRAGADATTSIAWLERANAGEVEEALAERTNARVPRYRQPRA